MEENLVLSKKDIERLIAAHDGDMALLYLYRLCLGPDQEQAAGDLFMTAAQVQAASEKLARAGLSAPSASAASGSAQRQSSSAQSEPQNRRIRPDDTLPEYSSGEISEHADGDARFRFLVDEAQHLKGKALSSADLRTLFGIYDYLALPAEVITMLLHFCTECYQERHGAESFPSFRLIQKEAFRWADRGITSLELAEEYISGYRARRTKQFEVAEMLQLEKRDLTDTESKYIGSWIAMGFPAETIKIAYDRTVTNTGKLSWPYLNKILLNWQEKGIVTPEDVQEKDSPHGAAKRSGSKNSTPASPRKKPSIEDLKKEISGKRNNS